VEERGDWRCRHCGETVEANFDLCWNCGADRMGQASGDFVPEPSDPAVDDPGLDTDPPEAERPDQADPLANSLLRYARIAWRLFQRLPSVLICLALLPCAIYAGFALGAMGGYTLSTNLGSIAIGAALASAGALKRGKWPSLLGMLALGTVLIPIADWLTPWTASTFPLLPEVVNVTALVVVVGLGEWLSVSDGSFRSLAWLVLVCTSAACAAGVFYFYASRVEFEILSTPMPAVLPVAIVAVAIWLAVPLALYAARCNRFRTQGVIAIVSVSGLAFTGFSYVQGVYWSAKLSLQGYPVLAKVVAVELLAVRGRESDFEFLVQRLHEADWDAPYTYTKHSQYHAGDWRQQTILKMRDHDPAWAAKELSEVLLARPNPTLIDMSYGLFVKQKRYEVVPIYMRYAMLDSQSPSIFAFVGEDRYKQKLEEFGAPQVVLAWIDDIAWQSVLSEAYDARESGRPARLDEVEPRFARPLRDRLAKLLRTDAGPYVADWEAAYDERIDALPTPLPPAVADETDRVVDCFLDFENAQARWFEARRQGMQEPREPDWNAPTTATLEKEVQRYLKEVEIATSAVH
jgi:hypothetical protein